MKKILTVVALGMMLAGCVYSPGPGYGYYGPGYHHGYYAY
jgi:PBP1b-binding outer membrane lipoprotein LpoB